MLVERTIRLLLYPVKKSCRQRCSKPTFLLPVNTLEGSVLLSEAHALRMYVDRAITTAEFTRCLARGVGGGEAYGADPRSVDR